MANKPTKRTVGLLVENMEKETQEAVAKAKKPVAKKAEKVSE